LTTCELTALADRTLSHARLLRQNAYEMVCQFIRNGFAQYHSIVTSFRQDNEIQLHVDRAAATRVGRSRGRPHVGDGFGSDEKKSQD
jgi:hypothetical protein